MPDSGGVMGESRVYSREQIVGRALADAALQKPLGQWTIAALSQRVLAALDGAGGRDGLTKEDIEALRVATLPNRHQPGVSAALSKLLRVGGAGGRQDEERRWLLKGNVNGDTIAFGPGLPPGEEVEVAPCGGAAGGREG